MDNILNYSEKVTDRYIQLVEDENIMMSDLIKILEYSFKKLNFKSIPEYAKQEEISDRAARDRLNNKKVVCVKLSGKTFIS
jgi:hypothetical protein